MSSASRTKYTWTPKNRRRVRFDLDEKVETMSIGAMSGPPSEWQRLGRSEFCSWSCTAKYAAQRAAQETKTQ